ncbi:LRR receptor-like serine/threonine-protein kinase RPK2 [Vitis vinifera]|uniref:non-specific serine/threonine protein kinase n=1 Tax=Vitis vinifera TaxID=29760 RepID=A0A438EB85_VITVI|nr:LRR receptor-like serine/threonine-protein kinase RPK2 [Vitis vinifera]
MAVLWILVFSLSFAFSHAVASVSRDAMLLLSFKSSISLDPASLLTDWNLSTNHCHWYGVTCDRFSGRVVALSITGSMSSSGLPELGYNFTGKDSVLVGTLSASIGGLSELRILSIPHNVFSGEIPADVAKLHKLEILQLQGNNFSGRIPDQISSLLSLRMLNLSYNVVSGQIPDKLIGSGKLRVIDLSNNQLSGEIGVDRFSECEFLVHLKLSHNFLTDNIPAEIGKCWNLRTLLLDSNIFEGRIPAEIGRISQLRVLDVSRNSLTDGIPKELANCRELSVIVLTNLDDFSSAEDNLADSSSGEFNAFMGGVPYELLLLPKLQIFGHLEQILVDGCLVIGVIHVHCEHSIWGRITLVLRYRKVWENARTLPFGFEFKCFGGIPPFSVALSIIMVSYGQAPIFLDVEDIQNAYSNIPVWGYQMSTIFGSLVDENLVFIHDFSWNRFIGPIPSFSIGGDFLATNHKPSYKLFLNNNALNGSLPGELVSNCNDLQTFSVNLSTNQLSGGIYPGLLLDCLQLKEFEAAHNQISGSIGPAIGNLKMLQRLDLRGNRLSGSLPGQLGMLKDLKWILLGGNNLTGEIPSQLGQLTSLIVLDLSRNGLTGSIPENLTNATNLEIVLLNHNRLVGEIPSSFSTLSSLTELDVSFNNLSGHIPQLQHLSNCDFFKGNQYLHPCLDPYSAPPDRLPDLLEVHKEYRQIMVLVLILGRRKISRLTSLRRKVVVTFADAPTEVNYDNVVRATGNFSIRNLIGTGGFGSTYKAELVPGFLVAVKRLSIGRFQGLQQFDAEIKTLGRIRHENLVTLIGYHVGETEMFLIYNFLSGGNLETFIHDRSGKNVQWPVIHKIALHIAQALAYLHYSCVPRIVHRDIKPSNILLDEELNAYLSDFGLARLLEVSETHATTDVAGTFGYVAPEYATTCRVSDKADVYSFGVVLLELMSGKKSLDPSFSEYGNGFNIVAWAKLLIKERRSSELFSPELWEVGPKENLLGMLKLASTCTVESISIRPSMRQVLLYWEFIVLRINQQAAEAMKYMKS